MLIIKKFVKTVIVLGILVGAVIFVITNWSWVFSKRVKGEIIEVERVTAPTAIFGRATEAQIHSYSVLIKAEDGKLYSASSEDRQWAVAKKGYCVEALLFRYPPWEFNHGNTYFNARLEQLEICPGGALPPSEVKLEESNTNPPAQEETAPSTGQ